MTSLEFLLLGSIVPVGSLVIAFGLLFLTRDDRKPVGRRSTRL